MRGPSSPRLLIWCLLLLAHLRLLMLHDSNFAKCSLANSSEQVEVVQVNWSIEVNDLSMRRCSWRGSAAVPARVSLGSVELTSGLQQTPPMVKSEGG